MKTKAVKRLEAIQRLEGAHVGMFLSSPRRGIPQGDGTVRVEDAKELVERRHAEAARLRKAFKL